MTDFARRIRRKLLGMHFKAQSGHLGTGLSSIEILGCVFNRWLRSADGDQFILSKGHGASALYAVLHEKGLLSDGELESYYKEGTLFPAHPAPNAHAAIPFATGSLGHGLPVAAGMAYSALHLESPKPASRFFCLLSDGECNEGSIWEAALFAGHHRLGNLAVLIDLNGLQGFGRTEEVLDMNPLRAKFEAFGFVVGEADGHDETALDRAFQDLQVDAAKPKCLIARTVKGKGVSFMENRLEWHYLPMSESQYRTALAEVDALGGSP